ncbi:phosphatase PAP2 family protein [Aquamicrobium segne]|uniref:Phosphatase PAP2 family protein n=1 Tax=Aquamicrobium segne TaxID=469547 RepID=A0ABW0GZG5_9HYPH
MIKTPACYEVAEKFLFRVTLALLAVDAFLITFHQAAIDWPAYSILSGLVLILLSLGFFYRQSGRSAELGSVTTAAGIFILFTGLLSLLNYLLTPNPRPTIDYWLMRLDTMLGYDWPTIVAWAGQYPWFNQVMRFAYISTLPQIVLLVIILALSNRIRELHSLMVSVAIASLMAVIFWTFLPSLGPSAYFELSADVLQRSRPVVSSTYGAEILSHLNNGISLLSPDEFRGMIAFPSMHIVLAGTATLHSRSIRWLFPAYILINLAVIPGVLVHGGHHLVDIPGGIALLVVALACTRKVLEPDHQQELAPDIRIIAESH